MDTFAAALSERYGADASSGDEIHSVRLFGSKARDDFEADSDLDVLVLTTHDEWQFRQAVSFLATDISPSGERLPSLRQRRLPALRSLELMRLTEEIVCRGDARKYTAFYCTGVYGGIATGCTVGCSLRCIFCWVDASRDFPETNGIPIAAF